MVKRGPHVRPQASEGEAQPGPFCWIRRFGQGDEPLRCGRCGQDRPGNEGYERTRSSAAGAEETVLPLEASRAGSWAAVAMAFQRSRRSGLAGDLCRDAAHAAVLKAQINKTDRNDARGIAQMMRAG